MTRLCLTVFSLLLLVAGTSFAAMDHKDLIEGPFASAQDVTKKCLECHEDQGKDILMTSHWNWGGKPNAVEGMEGKDGIYGKRNLINNFCISVEGGVKPNNKKKCTNCHIGFGWDGSGEFDHKNPENIDCLVCHTKEKIYLKAKKAGTAGVPAEALIKSGALDLVKAAQSVSTPDRDNCGTCHFYGGGGDAVKHGELDSTMAQKSDKLNKALDVHMGGMDMTCVDCHKGENHKIPGNSAMMATSEGRTSCEQCHADQHSDNKRLYKHTKSVACASCHIPAFARGQAVKMTWDWSTSGEDRPEDKIGEQYGKHTYKKIKGDFTWGMNVVPTYKWYNGKVKRYIKGDKIDPKATNNLTYPAGDVKDMSAKITPFKVHTGKQPYDTKNMYFLTPHTVGGYWSHFDWQKGLAEGAKGSGLKYSGSYSFAPTAEYIQVAHQVAPKEEALKCKDCHMGSKRIDWKDLGYEGDPMKKGGLRK